jgi:hypothetical protein
MSLYDDDRTIINPIKRSGIDEDPILNPIIKHLLHHYFNLLKTCSDLV